MTPAAPYQVAAAAYPIERLSTWDAYARKLECWVRDAASAGSTLLVFPEYAGLEAALVGATGDEAPTVWCHRAAAAAPDLATLCARLAVAHGVWILAGSLPCRDAGRLVNRAHLFSPAGTCAAHFDKQILTPWERQHTPLAPGDASTAVNAEPFERLGCLICYDIEFPLLARRFAADILVVPACTDDAAGQARVQIAARARALENQAVTLHAPLLGEVPDCAMVDSNTGAAGIFAPPDIGFPSDGVLALGAADIPGWVHATIDLTRLARTRSDGAVRPRAHWPESEYRDPPVTRDQN